MKTEKRQQQHNRTVWERFWQKRDIDEVYSNADRILAQIRSTGRIEGKWICEVGAGSGRDGLRLAELGGRVILLDYAENSLRIMQKKAREQGVEIHLVQGDAFHLPFRTDSLDWVYHQGLLEHFQEPAGIVAENFRVLKHGGFALADVPQRYHLYTLVKRVLIRLNRWFAGWETEFTISELRDLFLDAGFSEHHRYGDWMRPSFFYRSLREAAKRIGLRLPLQPPAIPPIRWLRDWTGERFKRTHAAFYTFMDIGVIGRK
ncbi:class I SAM-dependent methyltransferase [candidate division KSB1 bacterium]|nr:class I SAM-dependent methyltransferase [candidate division KSB1 bacterium]